MKCPKLAKKDSATLISRDIDTSSSVLCTRCELLDLDAVMSRPGLQQRIERLVQLSAQRNAAVMALEGLPLLLGGIGMWGGRERGERVKRLFYKREFWDD